MFLSCSHQKNTFILDNPTDTAFKTQAELEATYSATGIEAVREYHKAKFGTNDVFNYSKVADPLFNNPDYDDYTLQPLSPARHMSYDGTFIGAKDIAFPTFAYTDDLGHPNAFYNASKNANTLPLPASRNTCM